MLDQIAQAETDWARTVERLEAVRASKLRGAALAGKERLGLGD